jgi:hypothetical protein
MFPADKDLNRAFRLAYCLHPHLPTAVRITREALCDRFAVLSTLQHKQQQQRATRHHSAPQQAQTFYKLPYTSASMRLQASIYAVSEKWECGQEQSKPTIPYNVYAPTRYDRLVRYVKLLVAKTMDRPSHYVALGLGCHLYQYRPSHIAHLVLPLYTEDNIRRVNGYLLDWLTARFPSLPIVSQPPYGEKKVCTSPPTPQERELLYGALEILTPWDIPHLRRSDLHVQALYDLFKRQLQPGRAGLALEAKRRHAIVDPACAGLERVIRAYLQAYNSGHESQTMPGDNPYDKLTVPAFPADNDQATGGSDRFHPPPLSPEARLLMQDDFHRQQQRRRQYRPGLLQVRVDGIERLHFDPRQGACPALDVPLSASSVEVYGQDEAGELLLAVFPLAELLWAEDNHALRITHAGGQTLELIMAAEQGMSEDATERAVVQLTYMEVPPPLLARLWEAVATQWHRAETWLQRLFVRPLVPTVAAAVVCVLVVSNVWLGVFSTSGPSPREVPGWRGGQATPAVRVRVAFRSTSTEGEIRRLLQDIEGQLVGGPLTGPEEGYYVVDVPLRPAGPTTSDEVVSRLRQMDIIRDVMVLPPAP